MKKLILLILLLLSTSIYADNGQVSPVSNLDGSNTSVVNNNMGILQTGLNNLYTTYTTISGYFNSGILRTTNGGSSANLSSCTQGSVPYFSSAGVQSCLPPSTNGLFLKTQGVGANPTFSTPTGTGNVVYLYGDGGSGRYYTNATSTPPAVPTLTYQLWGTANDATYRTIIDTKFTKISGISTLTFYTAQASRVGGAGTVKSRILVNLGALTSTEGTSTAGVGVITWVSGTLDVSSLTNGQVYDMQVQLYCDISQAAAFGGIIFGS